MDDHFVNYQGNQYITFSFILTPPHTLEDISDRKGSVDWPLPGLIIIYARRDCGFLAFVSVSQAPHKHVNVKYFKDSAHFRFVPDIRPAELLT